MIIDFNAMYDVDKFIYNLSQPISKCLFNFKGVRLLNDLYIGDTNDSNITELYNKLLNRDLVITKYDTDCYIPSGSICDFDISDNKFFITINNEFFELDIHELENISIDIKLFITGEQCLTYNSNIEEIFDTIKYINKMNIFFAYAPKIMTDTFSNEELFNHFKNSTCDTIECNDDDIHYRLMDTISGQLNTLLKDKLDGPDDTRITVNKTLYYLNQYESEFTISGNFICCFYQIDSLYKLDISALRKLIMEHKFDKIDLYDVDIIYDIPHENISPDYKPTYVSIKYKITYLCAMSDWIE